ncbi:CTP synthetase [Sediminimonas sp.]|uniref:CTP synthetase n=1 Tax=Sediminimonas sp. TaxID=2823379 RepID=UPI0025DB9BDA|nr:CTP synthetase [Sediminimonas sp.]
MLKVALLVYLFAGVTLAGSFMVAALVAGYDTLNPILIAVGVGAVIAMPVSWAVARAITSDS